MRFAAGAPKDRRPSRGTVRRACPRAENGAGLVSRAPSRRSGSASHLHRWDRARAPECVAPQYCEAGPRFRRPYRDAVPERPEITDHQDLMRAPAIEGFCCLRLRLPRELGGSPSRNRCRFWPSGLFQSLFPHGPSTPESSPLALLALVQSFQDLEHRPRAGFLCREDNRPDGVCPEAVMPPKSIELADNLIETAVDRAQRIVNLHHVHLLHYATHNERSFTGGESTRFRRLPNRRFR